MRKLRMFFPKILSLYMISIQERFVIKNGLWWRAQSICIWIFCYKNCEIIKVIPEVYISSFVSLLNKIASFFCWNIGKILPFFYKGIIFIPAFALLNPRLKFSQHVISTLPFVHFHNPSVLFLSAVRKSRATPSMGFLILEHAKLVKGPV